MGLITALVKARVRSSRKKQVNPNATGERFTVPRSGMDGVDVLLYRPRAGTKCPMPALFNVHGGAWVGCDASMQDSFCAEMSERLGCLIVNVNYKKLDIHPFPYPQEELRDTVLWFAAHADAYGVDPARFATLGYSAGGHLCAAAGLLLKESGFALSCQVLSYPFLDFTVGTQDGMASSSLIDKIFFQKGANKSDPVLSPGAAPVERLRGLPPTVLIIVEKDALYQQALDFADKLTRAGVDLERLEYPSAKHGFLEVNRPEYREDGAKSPEQAVIARQCEHDLEAILKRRWNTE